MSGELMALGPELLNLQRALGVVLGEGARDEAWRAQIEALALGTQGLMSRDRDIVLYLLAQDAQRGLEAYSSRHALFCAVVVMLCAAELKWPDDEAATLVRAALTMNLSMTALQNELTFRERTPTVEQRRTVEEHPAHSADLLRAAGIDDALWPEIVARHHEEPPADSVLADLPPAQRLASLLHRVDVFTAKLSARQSRAAMSATMAAREAFLGANGRPDELGTAVIKVLGIYPPGSYVKLASGEFAVVRRRGAKANEPLVLSLAGRDGRALAAPVLRNTGFAEHAVKSVARTVESRVLAEHLRSASLALT